MNVKKPAETTSAIRTFWNKEALLKDGRVAYAKVFKEASASEDCVMELIDSGIIPLIEHEQETVDFGYTAVRIDKNSFDSHFPR